MIVGLCAFVVSELFDLVVRTVHRGIVDSCQGDRKGPCEHKSMEGELVTCSDRCGSFKRN